MLKYIEFWFGVVFHLLTLSLQDYYAGLDCLSLLFDFFHYCCGIYCHRLIFFLQFFVAIFNVLSDPCPLRTVIGELYLYFNILSVWNILWFFFYFSSLWPCPLQTTHPLPGHHFRAFPFFDWARILFGAPIDINLIKVYFCWKRGYFQLYLFLDIRSWTVMLS